MRRGPPTSSIYYDAGVYFLFDEQRIIVGFGLFRPTDYLSGWAPGSTRDRAR